MSTRRQNLQVLINPTWEEMLEREPLTGFSFFLSGRVNVLLGVADEILENLDQGFSKESVDGSRIDRAETLLWLWILGAYEVVRTMTQARDCFAPRVHDELTRLKRGLSAVRMPAAKMEKPGKKQPVTSNRSPFGWDISKRDLLVNDPEVAPDLSARDLLAKFEQVFSAIRKEDVLRPHEASYTGA